MNAGNNKIRVTANSSSGGPNLDKMDVISEEDQAAGTKKCALVNENSTATLSCPSGQVIESIDFSSYGLPTGSCPNFLKTSSCHSTASHRTIESLCLDQQSCKVGANNAVFGDPCSGKFKKLAVVYTCSGETAGLASKDFVGHYERNPILNNWHKVDISLVNTALRWKNAAGVTWSLSYVNGVLKTGSDCPYGVKVIEVGKHPGSDPVNSLKFNGENYYKTNDNVDNCTGDPNKTEPGECGCGVPEGTCNTRSITHLGTTQIWDSNGQNINIARPSGSKAGDLLVLILHRTDDDLPLYVDGWTRVAECYKKDNGYDCSTEEDCTSWHNDDFCGTFERDHGGHDLAQSIFVRKVGSTEPNSYQFNLNRDSSGHPGWIILTALRGANTSDPVRDWSYKGCDGVADSLFPSVYGHKGDMVLLSQSFDDAVAKSKFNAPDNTSTFGYVSNSDEAGFLFGGILDSNGETGTMKTHGDGASACKDALISLTIKPR